VEVVNLRVRAVGALPPPAFEPLPPGGPDPAAAWLGRESVYFDSDARDAGGLAGIAATPTDLYDRDLLRPGNRLRGPAILFQLDATSVVPPGWQGQVDTAGNILLES
jgi:N-methylhydantoinase A